ncbi:MAG: sensor histidine kinase, partial [Acidimicrobiia bacterium]
ILDNALRFRALAPPEVTVTAERSAAGWRVALSDNGRGLEAVELPRLFTVFARPTIASEGIAGAGLGLAVCRRIVERHGGTIWAEANEWGGITVFLELPGILELLGD